MASCTVPGCTETGLSRQNRHGKCRIHWNEYVREWYRTPKGEERKRKQKLAKYGLSVERYDALLDAQGGLCAICCQPETHVVAGRLSELSIDHCHKTGDVRGLLCHKCNNMLARADDNPEYLRAAALYLERCTLLRKVALV